MAEKTLGYKVSTSNTYIIYIISLSVCTVENKSKIFFLTDRSFFVPVGVSKDNSAVEVPSGEMQNLSKG